MNKNWELLQFLGIEHPRYLDCQVKAQWEEKNYRAARILLNGYIPVLLLTPRNKSVYKPLLYCHANPENKALGKDELISGIPELQKPTYAEVLTAEGYLVICIDNLGFGERSQRSLDSYFKEYLWKGKNLWGQFVLDNLIALDYLLSLEEVDMEKTTVLGFSMGSTLAYWLAALDPRIKTCIEMCGLTDSEWLEDTAAYDTRSFYFFIYNLYNKYSTTAINKLIAPRRHIALAGLADPRTPEVGLDRIDASLQAEYAALGAKANWKLFKFDSGHLETEEMRARVMEILKER